jgi:hypothetical protein
MRCVIMQPTYMPWAGYLNLIARADVFVFLDDVQFEKQSWQNRNRVLVQGAPHWLTVPVLRQHLADPIHSIAVDDGQPWRRKHLELLRTSYARHPYTGDMLALASGIADMEHTHLCEINMAVIRSLAAALGLEPRFLRSSALGIDGPRSQRLVDICTHLDCDQYLSPNGARDYLAQDGAFDASRVQLGFQQFDAKYYVQKGAPEFVSHLSILDVIANLGLQGARHYVLG